MRRVHKANDCAELDVVSVPWAHPGGVSGWLRSHRQHQQNSLLRAAGTLNPLVGCPGSPQADQPEGRTKLNSIGKNSWLIGCASC